MGCVAPSAETWRTEPEGWEDDFVLSELERAWVNGWGGTVKFPPEKGPPYAHQHHDWTNFRAGTLREVRRRGLKIPKGLAMKLRELGNNV